jgi:hypothetical protein
MTEHLNQAIDTNLRRKRPAGIYDAASTIPAQHFLRKCGIGKLATAS